MTADRIGYGMGKKEFDRPNCVRAMLGETDGKTDCVSELSCNLDDMTAEEIGFAIEMLLDGGALDVYTIPIGMKKNRPGTMLCVLCRDDDKAALIHLIFKHTTTLGIREKAYSRHTLERRIETIETCFGPIRRKDAFGYGISRSKYEYDDLARIAREQGLSITEIKEKLS